MPLMVNYIMGGVENQVKISILIRKNLTYEFPQ
jgi:hypothetical protein